MPLRSVVVIMTIKTVKHHHKMTYIIVLRQYLLKYADVWKNGLSTVELVWKIVITTI